MRPTRLHTVALLLGTFLFAGQAQAKRLPPVEVAPVVIDGVRYEAPHFDNPCGQNGGCVVAYDDQTGRELWSVSVYQVHYQSNLETDVQDVFITSLSKDGNYLLVENESGQHFTLDPRTRDVSGEAPGASSPASCQLGPASVRSTTSWWPIGLALAALLRRPLRHLTGRSRRARRA